MEKVCRLEVWYYNRWKLGINEYHSIEEAKKRKAQMEAAGHKVRIVESQFDNMPHKLNLNGR